MATSPACLPPKAPPVGGTTTRTSPSSIPTAWATVLLVLKWTWSPVQTVSGARRPIRPGPLASPRARGPGRPSCRWHAPPRRWHPARRPRRRRRRRPPVPTPRRPPGGPDERLVPHDRHLGHGFRRAGVDRPQGRAGHGRSEHGAVAHPRARQVRREAPAAGDRVQASRLVARSTHQAPVHGATRVGSASSTTSWHPSVSRAGPPAPARATRAPPRPAAGTRRCRASNGCRTCRCRRGTRRCPLGPPSPGRGPRPAHRRRGGGRRSGCPGRRRPCR